MAPSRGMEKEKVRRVTLTKKHEGMNRLLGTVTRKVDVWKAETDEQAIHTARKWWDGVGIDTSDWEATVEQVESAVRWVMVKNIGV